MDQMPTMQEWRRLHAAGQLKGPQTLFFQPDKPEDELHDTAADPHEIDNLARSPKHKDVLERLRRRLATWQKETGDLGDIPEDKLWEKVRPGGVWAVTATPVIEPKGGKFDGPVKVKITCPTAGASLAYTFEEGKNARWLLYTGEITVREGGTLRVLACRLGYKDSVESQTIFKVTKER
jgi:hypothetical protein